MLFQIKVNKRSIVTRTDIRCHENFQHLNEKNLEKLRHHSKIDFVQHCSSRYRKSFLIVMPKPKKTNVSSFLLNFLCIALLRPKCKTFESLLIDTIDSIWKYFRCFVVRPIADVIVTNSMLFSSSRAIDPTNNVEQNSHIRRETPLC